MCLICIELVKHRMTLGEAERASFELIIDKEPNSHEHKLRKALKTYDIDELGKLLEEGTEDGRE